ncbi:hypothetical protein PY650_24125 [Rhizobium calliandrae]|uniref:Pepco domain-containing protein n=1 Tax=Rhizobium calliandrae TaxID=1312182 RepID=A0ABT7KJ56_9HYPH|nr:hypothetical protein [Rhizobium calliandrae]MDL2408674.1 hypothetical protein [Rhizobium calliandrae]
MNREITIITDAHSSSSFATGPIIGEQGARGGDDIGGGFGSIVGSPFKAVSIGADALKGQMANLLEVVQHVFDQPLSRLAMALDEVELSVEISSEGEVRVFGSGGKLGGNGAIKLVFKRREPPVAAQSFADASEAQAEVHGS